MQGVKVVRKLKQRYRITFIIFIICSLLLTSCNKQFGSPSLTLQRGSDKAVNLQNGPQLFVPQLLANKGVKTPKEPLGDNEQIDLAGSRFFKLNQQVKGIYVPGDMAVDNRLDSLIKLVRNAHLNAVVIDIKNDNGQITYHSQVPLVRKIGSDRTAKIKNIGAFVQKLKKSRIYVIGRLVTFKDPYLAMKRKSWAIHRKNGTVWKDRHGISWVDPYRPEVQSYNIEIALEAAKKGFDEIQFDYVRFPEHAEKLAREVQFQNPLKLEKWELIAAFFKTASVPIHAQHALLAADVFGLTTSTSDDMGIGQQWGQIVRNVDIICPMIYPSHYTQGNYGVKYPDLQPYAVVRKALSDAIEKNRRLEKQQLHTAEIRPWLQAFTASWVKPHQHYGVKQIQEQIEAARSLKIDGYLLWNPSNPNKMMKSLGNSNNY